jgi:hypothetical protein
MFAAVVSREQNAERRVVGLGRRNQILPLLVLRRSSSAWRRAELFISERNVLAARENNNSMNNHSRFRSDPEPRKNKSQFSEQATHFKIIIWRLCFGCGHQEENKWIRRSPVFWALRLH